MANFTYDQRKLLNQLFIGSKLGDAVADLQARVIALEAKKGVTPQALPAKISAFRRMLNYICPRAFLGDTIADLQARIATLEAL